MRTRSSSGAGVSDARMGRSLPGAEAEVDPMCNARRRWHRRSSVAAARAVSVMRRGSGQPGGKRASVTAAGQVDRAAGSFGSREDRSRRTPVASAVPQASGGLRSPRLWSAPARRRDGARLGHRTLFRLARAGSARRWVWPSEGRGGAVLVSYPPKQASPKTPLVIANAVCERGALSALEFETSAAQAV